MLSNMKIGRKLAFGFGIMTFLLLLVGSVGFYSFQNVSTDMKQSNRLMNVYSTLNTAVAENYRGQIASNLYSKTRSPSHLQAAVGHFEAAEAACDETMDQMVTEKSKGVARAIKTEVIAYKELDIKYGEIVNRLRESDLKLEERFSKIDALLTKLNEDIQKKALAHVTKEKNDDGTEEEFIPKNLSLASTTAVRMLESTEMLAFRAYRFSHASNEGDREWDSVRASARCDNPKDSRFRSWSC